MENDDEVIIMCDIQEMTKHFVVEYSLLWLDPQNQSQTCQEQVEEMKMRYDLKISVAAANWKDVINQIAIEKTTHHLILSGIQDQTFLKEIENVSNIALIFIFDNNFPTSFNRSNFPKIQCIETNIKDLSIKIDERLTKWQREESSLRTDFPAFAPIFDDYDKSKMNYLHYYLQGFTNFQNRAQAKRDFLNLAKQIDKNKDDLRNFENDYNNYNMASILNWYTKNSFVYKMTNNCLRIATSDSIQYCRFLLKDLETAIKEQFQEKSKHFSGILYRGAFMSSQDWEKLKNNIGRDIEMHGFLSTSKFERVAFNFLKVNPEQKALITIIVPRCSDKEEQGFVEIKEFSAFQDEEEILFNVRSRFTILDAGTRLFLGKQCRHLILLYGKQAWKIDASSNKKSFKIDVDLVVNQKCSLCEKDLEHSQTKLFTSITSQIQSICELCLALEKEYTPLLFLDSKTLPPQKRITVSIEGEILIQPTDSRTPFYGYKCSECQTKRISAVYYLKCLSCPDGQNLWCKKCQGCQNTNHSHIIERSGFSYWSEQLSLQEKDFLNFQLKGLQQSNAFHQGEVFFKGQEFTKAMRYYEKVIEQQQDDPLIHGAHHGLGLVYKELGELKKAITSYDKALLLLQKPSNPTSDAQTAKSYHGLGVVHKMLGDFKSSKRFYEKSLEIREAVYKLQHPEIAESYDGLAGVYETLGDFKRAILFYQKGLDMFRQVYGENHPLTAKSYNNLATVYTTQGDNKKAIEYYEKALEIDKLVLGDFHPDTAFVYSSLGIEYSKGIDLHKSKEFLNKSIEILKAIYGDHNQHVIIPNNNLATIYMSSGRYYEALELYKKNLKIGIDIYGENNPTLGIYYENLGTAFVKLQEFSKASEYLFKCLDILKAAYNTEIHNEIASCYCKIAELHKEMNNNECALEYDYKALEIYRFIFGETHPHVGASYHNIAIIYMIQYNYPKAVEYYLKNVEIAQQIFCEYNIDLAKTYCSLALVYERMGNYPNCIDYNEQALVIFDAFYGQDHIETATCYNQMGACFRRAGDFQKAIQSHKRALKIYKASYTDSENYEEIALSYDLMGSSYREMQEFEAALEHHEKCLDIRKKIDGTTPYKLGESLINIGKAYQELGDFPKATEYYTQIIERPGEEDANTYHAYEGLALIHLDEEDSEGAVECFKKSENLCLKFYGEEHEQTAAFYFNWGTAEANIENYENSVKLFLRSLEVKKKVFGENHPKLRSNYIYISQLYECLEDEEKSELFSQMAENLEAQQTGGV